MPLRLDDTVQRYLLSTTSRVVGEFASEHLLITHAWPGKYSVRGSSRWEPGPASRTTFVASFRTPPIERAPGVIVPDYSYVGDILIPILSLLFGKRFDQHGLIEGSGRFLIPDLSHFDNLCNPRLPQNSHSVREDYPTPLDLREFRRIMPLWATDPPVIDARFFNTFSSAAKFYHQALVNFDSDPEVAYLHLITAGEIVSNFRAFDPESLLDEQTRLHLASIRGGLTDGDAIARHLHGRLRQIKRRFRLTLEQLVDSDFFSRSECTQAYGRLEASNFSKRIAAAYDLRSQYVHSGESFGDYVRAHGETNAEVQKGLPRHHNRDLAKTLQLAPTLIGMERIVRYCLLRLAEEVRAYWNPAQPD